MIAETTLHLPLKKKWYDMIESGIKKEEYRDVTPYYASRLFLNGDWIYLKQNTLSDLLMDKVKRLAGNENELRWKTHKQVVFSYGYTNRTMTFEVEELKIGKGNSEWGAEPDKEYFVIKLGKRIN